MWRRIGIPIMLTVAIGAGVAGGAALAGTSTPAGTNTPAPPRRPPHNMGNLLKLKPHNVSNYSIPELQLTVGPGGVVHGLDQCPSGTVPLGGGVATSASDLVTTLDSYPVDGPPEVGWAVDIRNLDPKHSYTDNFVEAICGS